MIDIGSNNLKRIINNKKKFEIYDFIINCNVPVLIDIGWGQNNQINSITIREDTKGKNDQSDKRSLTKKCRNIIEFCNNFPNIDAEDIFNLEDEIELKTSLSNYFQIVNNYMKKEEIFNENNDEEKKNIKKQIENFIHVQLYEKIFYKTIVSADKSTFYNFVKLSWVKPYMLDEGLKYIDEKMIQLIPYLIQEK